MSLGDSVVGYHFEERLCRKTLILDFSEESGVTYDREGFVLPKAGCEKSERLCVVSRLDIPRQMWVVELRNRYRMSSTYDYVSSDERISIRNLTETEDIDRLVETVELPAREEDLPVQFAGRKVFYRVNCTIAHTPVLVGAEPEDLYLDSKCINRRRAVACWSEIYKIWKPLSPEGDAFYRKPKADYEIVSAAISRAAEQGLEILPG